MIRRSLPGQTVLNFRSVLLMWVICSLTVTTLVAADDAPPATKRAAGKDVFGQSKVWKIEIEIPVKEYEAMQPPPPTGFGPPGAPGAAPPVVRNANEKRGSERNLFGTEFPWAHADLRTEGKNYKNIGVRYSGEITYFASAQVLKRPLKIEFNKFEDQEFEGLTSLQFHSMPMDPAKGREVLAYSIFQAAGVPSQRTGFAEITLTVPGKFDKELLGLYLVVENVDKRFLQDRFDSVQGLLMKPFQVRSMDYFGDDFERYKGLYRPESEPTKEQAQRVMAFAKLVHQANDDEFRKELGSYLDVDAFLRFLAANSLSTNLESVFALGHNYHLFLNPRTNKFVFLPGDLEFALANFLLMGTADQLMDLSLVHPYPGENKLVERVLATPEISQKYQDLLKSLSETSFTKERLNGEIDALEAFTKEALASEKLAADKRKEAPPAFGPPGADAPKPPDLKSFVQKRTISVTRQLASMSKGYVPVSFGFGPPPGAGSGPAGRAAPNQPIDEGAFREAVNAPEGIDVTLFATPPQVGYPVALATAPNGDLFVAVDEQGSIGRTPGGGKVLRCVDRDGDGKVDDVTLFAKMDHPRGLIYQDGALWVLHAASLSVYQDRGKGEARESEVLVTGLTSDMVNQRGGDHATNGIRMGLDGWIYIAVGDYGCPEANGKDGSRVAIRGGILRVRPDGSDLEVFVTGLRNPFDIGIDPYMNLFTRDNDDNRAGGWDIRVLHLIQSGYYGYSQHYANFPDEIMPPLGQFGGGSGVGTLFLQDERWPEKYNDVLFTGDWGRSEVYRHELKKNGPTFDLKQEVFLKFPRPTGIDLDASGRLYVASWRGGEASTYVGPNVGFIARVTPSGWKPSPIRDLKLADVQELIRLLNGPNIVSRLHSQREILRRGSTVEITKALLSLASDAKSKLEGRVAAILTLKQLNGQTCHQALLELLSDSSVREFAMRALTDRKRELNDLEAKPFVAALTDASPRVRAQALISLGRLNDQSVARNVLPLTRRPEGSVMPTRKEVHAQPDPDRVIPHLALRTLISLEAINACLEAVDGPDSDAALRALRYMHDKKSVDGLIQKLGTIRSADLRRDVLATLIRLYYREADYKGAWWGIRPENQGPYFDTVEWDRTARIGTVVTRAVLDADAETARFLRNDLARHRVELEGLPKATHTAPIADEVAPLVMRPADPSNPDQIGNMIYEAVLSRVLKVKGDPAKGQLLFKAQSCNACHTDADGQTLKGPHLVGIGKRYSTSELAESILKPSLKIAQGFEGYVFEMANGKIYTGFIVSQSAKNFLIREPNGVPRELKMSEIESKVVQKQSNMPEGIVANLTPEDLSDLIAYLQSLGGNDPGAPSKPVTMTTEEDHRQMMAQLGITKLRPGPNGNENAPNHANYDESLANPFPNLPELLTMRDGTLVKNPDDWKKRRLEIEEDFEREFYGRIPNDVPKLTWTVKETTETMIGDIPVIEKQIQGVVDNSACPEIEVKISMTLTLPKTATRPVPVLMMFGGFGFGPPRRPGSTPAVSPRGTAPAGPSRSETLLIAGWGFAMLSPNSIQADNGAGLTRGIIGLTNKGQPRKPDDWGSLRAWGWGASRGLDYLETDPAVDATRVGIEGVSRYGKAALVAMAFEPRFAMVLVGSSGEGGAKLHRRNFGEAVENLTGSGEYHWMAGNFLKYGTAESKFGSLNASNMPVDSHQLIALCAPRLTFISYGIPEKGDAKWLDQQGSYMAAVAAGPAFRLLGARDLGTSDDYQKEKMPAVNVGLLNGELAWRQHDGGHTDGPNLEYFIKWVDERWMRNQK